MSDKAGTTDNSESASPNDLPYLVVDRDGPNTPDRHGVFWRVFSILRFIPLIILMVAVIGVVALYFQPPGLQKLMQLLNLQPGAGTSSPIAIPVDRESQAKETPPVPTTQPVVGLGILLPKGDITRVAMPFGAADARIASIEVTEGQEVRRGKVLAVLDNHESLLSQVEIARANRDTRAAQLRQTRNSVSASLAETQASLESARSRLATAQSDLERFTSLFERGFTTNAVLDQKKTALDQAVNEVSRLEATLARFEGTDVEDQPDVQVAQRNLEAAEAELSKVRRDLVKARIIAPVSGTILDIKVRPGERPGSEGIADIGNIEQMTARIEVYQNDIARVKTGARVTLESDALPETLNATVTRIGLEVGRQTLIDSSPAANTDARVIEVTATLDEDSSASARGFTNLQVIARIMTGEGQASQ